MKIGSRSVVEYGQAFKTLCDRLAAIGKPVDAADQSHWFLRGLGSRFATFSASQMAISPLPIFSELLPRAQSFELFLRSLEPSSPVPAAFAATTGHGSSPPPKSSGRGSSSAGHRGGHGGTGGRPNSGRGGGSGFRRPPRCQICRGEHYADMCPQFLQARASQNPSAQLAQAFNASCNISQPTSDWFVDSGASAHMTSQTSGLDSFEPYTGNGRVIVGNGNSLSISHIGSRDFSNGVKLLDVLVVPHLTKNLVSISKLTHDYPVDVVYSDKSFEIQSRANKTVLAQGRCDQGLYILARAFSVDFCSTFYGFEG